MKESTNERALRFVKNEFKHVQRLREEFGDHVYFSSLGESIVDSLVLMHEGADATVRFMGLEYLRLILNSLQAENETSVTSFTHGVRESLFEHGNVLGGEKPTTPKGELDYQLILQAKTLVDTIIKRLPEETPSIETERDLLSLLVSLLTIHTGRKTSIKSIAQGMTSALRSRRVVN